VQNQTPIDPLIGLTVSQYEIVAKLGGGGMGVVYKARDIKLGRTVALKFLPPQWSHDDGAKQRFIREAQAASATNHRNICVIHNIDETDDGRLFIVMAYYEGETLKQRLDQGAFDIHEAIEIGCEIAEGLAKAHAQGVVHRDVKPGNLIVTDDGVKILDFGLAKFADALQLTIPGTTIGTVAYMSPEQARGEDADARSDVWALGIVMFEMLTGAPPFRGAYPEATFHAIKHEPLPSLRNARPDIPDGLERIVLKALEKDPAQRFQTAREPARDLRMLLGRTVPLELRTEEVPVLGVLRRAPPVPRRSWIRRTVTPLRAVIALLILLAAAAGGYFWITRPVQRIRVAIVPVANHTGDPDLDRYRLALTQTLIDEISESPNIRVVPYLRLVEMIRPFLAARGDPSSNDAIHAIATESGAPFLAVPTLVYRDRDAKWLVEIQIRNATTGTAVASYETTPITSSLSKQTALRLVASAADSIQQHFKVNGPGRSFQQRSTASRFREPDAARGFEEGLNAYEQLEYSAALDAFNRSLALDDQHALTQAWLSRVLLILYRQNEAVAAGQRARALVGGNLSASETAFVLAVLAESQGDLIAADARYRELVKLEPDDPWALAELADFMKRRQDQNPAAVERYHKVLDADPSYIRPHVDLCQVYTRVDDHPLAEKEAQLAIERYRALGMKSGEAQALQCLGEAEREQGGEHLADARKNIDAARGIIEVLSQPYNLSRVVFYQALVAYSSNRIRDAAELFETAATAAGAVGNRLTEGTALMNLGATSERLGHPTRGMEFFRRSRDVFVQLKDERRVAEADVNEAGLKIDYGDDLDAARRTLANARVNLERLGHVDFQLIAMHSEADNDRHAGRVAEARRLLQVASEVATKNDLRDQRDSLSVTLALVDFQVSEYARARETLERLFEASPTVEQADGHIAYGRVLTALADFNGARQALATAVEQINAGQRDGLLPAVHAGFGQLAYEQKAIADARAHFDAAIAAWSDPLPNIAIAEAYCTRGLLNAEAGNRAAARRDLNEGLRIATRSGHLPIEVRCRTQIARLDLLEGMAKDAFDVLSKIPDDSAEMTIGPELRAQAEYWRGAALSSQGLAGGAERQEHARTLIATLQGALPAASRDGFGARLDIGDILRGPVRIQQ